MSRRSSSDRIRRLLVRLSVTTTAIATTTTTTTTTTAILLGPHTVDNCRASLTSHTPRCRPAAFYVRQFPFLVYRADFFIWKTATATADTCACRRGWRWRLPFWRLCGTRRTAGRKGARRRRALTNHSTLCAHKQSLAFEVLISSRNDVIQKIAQWRRSP